MRDEMNCKTFTYLWCHEFRCTTESARGRTIPHVFLAQTVIRNLDVSIKSKHDVVKLQITVDDAIFVEILEGKADFGSVESGKHISKKKGRKR